MLGCGNTVGLTLSDSSFSSYTGDTVKLQTFPRLFTAILCIVLCPHQVRITACAASVV